jgi:hypothetical protein
LETGVSRTICPGWLQTSVLPISASQVARITGVSQQSPAVLLQSIFHWFASTPLVMIKNHWDENIHADVNTLTIYKIELNLHWLQIINWKLIFVFYENPEICLSSCDWLLLKLECNGVETLVPQSLQISHFWSSLMA